jgi:hypothetical protein
VDFLFECFFIKEGLAVDPVVLGQGRALLGRKDLLQMVLFHFCKFWCFELPRQRLDYGLKFRRGGEGVKE